MPSQRAYDLEQEGRALVERLGGRWKGCSGLCRCPAHEDRTPSLSVRVGDIRLLLHCFAGCSSRDVLAALQAQGLLEPRPGYHAAVRWSPSADRLNAPALKIWDESRPLAASPAQDYLAGRAICTHSTELRYHPRTPCGPRPVTDYRPAMIAAVRDERGLVAIHRTFIEPGRRALARFDGARRGLGRFGHGAVRLGGAGPRLGLAEGIETALSASLLFGLPCWATLGTERFRLVAIPEATEQVLLFLDHDAGGRRAEALAHRAFAHVPRLEAHYPSQPGDDWNDVLRRTRAPAGDSALPLEPGPDVPG